MPIIYYAQVNNESAMRVHMDDKQSKRTSKRANERKKETKERDDANFSY